MLKAVFDASVLISAFLSRENPGGASNELLQFVAAGAIELCLSIEIIDEAVEILLDSERLRQRYRYSAEQVGQYRADLMTLAHTIDDPPPMAGAVPRDPDDDKIVACAGGGGCRLRRYPDRDLLDLGAHDAITMLAPEQFLPLVRDQVGR